MDFILPEKVNYLFEIFKQEHKELYIVGGCVRDMVMGTVPHDYDFTTNATPDEMDGIAQKYNIETLHTGRLYGTVTFKFGKELYEITTYRSESTYSDNRHPDSIKFSSYLEADLQRRDFTINAMAWNPEQGLIDRYDGIKDIESKIIRTVGEPYERFNEDALRILRALRFAARFEFDIEADNTLQAMFDLEYKISSLSKERIGSEIAQTFSYPNTLFGTEYFCCKALNIPLNYYNKNTKTLEGRLAQLMPAVYTVKDVEDKLLPYGFGSDVVDRVNKLLTSARILYNREGPPIKEILSILRTPLERKLMFDFLDFPPKELRTITTAMIDNDPVCIEDLDIDGNDLIAMGLKGKQIGKMLKLLLYYIYDNPEKNTKDDLIKYVKNHKEEIE